MKIVDAAGNNRAANVTPGNAVEVAPGGTSLSVLTSVASVNSATQLLAANVARAAAYFFNDSTAILYLAFANTASTSSYTVQIASNSFYEMPSLPCYQGVISGIWSAANGNVRITELS